MLAATTFPDWLDHGCKGGTLSFRAREKFPVFTLVVEVGKDDTSRSLVVDVYISINGRKIQTSEYLSCLETTRGGNVALFDLEMIDDIRLEVETMFDKYLEMGWNDVEIEFRNLNPPDMSIVSCGLCVNKLLTNMRNIRFKSSLKRRAMASPSNEPPKKLLRKFRAPDKAKLSNTKKGTRRIKRRPFCHSYKRKMFFPMGKHFWRFLYYY
ncbi:hypothetical protein QN277_005901 [Acacia crassicarpa]|uniref:Uncharacterized protein n=1 Tax=Acacia crassicarpa TaxID=499986 RepID=A0AAE1MBP8_9FABA|nr:hypothetical protein QN277_005901 [Acacia crassicarpa]